MVGNLQLEDPRLTMLYDILRAHPQGIKEYDLLKILGDTEIIEETLKSDDHQNLVLFQKHFALFHQLYRLRAQLRAASIADLEIHCLRICLHPIARSVKTDHPTPKDPLEAYYMDLRNLRETGARDVEDMLDSFWQRFNKHEGRAEALEVFELKEPAGAVQIKRRYRELVSRHHPDRGGDAEQFRQVMKAAAVLMG